MTCRLLLLSNSRDAEGRFLTYPRARIRAFLGERVRSALFVPFAGVMGSWEEYEARVRPPFAEMGYAITSIHAAADQPAALYGAEAIVIGGGNTFRLLSQLYERGLLQAIQDRVRAGMPYIGWSAGSVLACPTIRTTNDMPIVQPPSLEALGLVPFQINAHYTDAHPPGFQGETRAERIAEFLELNPEQVVVGLPEGSMLQVEQNSVALHGDAGARLFVHGTPPRQVALGESLDFLLTR